MNLKAADDGVAGGCSTMGWGSEGDMSCVCGRAGGWVGSGLIYWRIGKRARTPVPAKQKPIRKPSQKKMIIMIMRRRRRRKERERERAKNGNLCSTRHFLHIFMEKTGFYCWRKAKIVFFSRVSSSSSPSSSSSSSSSFWFSFKRKTRVENENHFFFCCFYL